jgi:hypothetical protein
MGGDITVNVRVSELIRKIPVPCENQMFIEVLETAQSGIYPEPD